MKHFLDADLALARSAAEQAGEQIRAGWLRGAASLDIRYKGEVDLVSEIDLAAEATVLRCLQGARPQDDIVAEESGLAVGTPAPLSESAGPDFGGGSGRRWYVDPLDGTTNFSHGLPHFCVSIGLADDEGPAVGVVHDPIRRWTFHGRRGGGAWLDGRRLQVSAESQLDRALLATGFPYDRRTNPDNNTHRFAHLLRRVQGIRRAGSAALDLAWVAAGWLDGYWEDRLNAWDLMAGALLVLEAGGSVTGFGGQTVDIRRGALIASNGCIHDPLVAELGNAQLVPG